MTHDELVERVARAIDPAAWNPRFIEAIPDPKTRQAVSKSRATAAIAAVYEAMEEPTPEMERVSALTVDVPLNAARITQWGANAWPAMLAASPLNPEVK
jgi:hypothetical protein